MIDYVDEIIASTAQTLLILTVVAEYLFLCDMFVFVNSLANLNRDSSNLCLCGCALTLTRSRLENEQTL